MSDYPASIDCKAKKWLIKSKDELLSKSQSREPMTQKQADKLVLNLGNQLVESVIFSNLEKLKISCSYPIENFLPKAGSYYKKTYSEKGLFNIFPTHIVIEEVWHAFDDQSVLMVALANERVVSAGNFLEQVKDLAGAKKTLGIPNDLGGARDIISIANQPRQLLALSFKEACQYIDSRAAVLNRLMFSPVFRVNMESLLIDTDGWVDSVKYFMETRENSLKTSFNNYCVGLQQKNFLEGFLATQRLTLNSKNTLQ